MSPVIFVTYVSGLHHQNFKLCPTRREINRGLRGFHGFGTEQLRFSALIRVIRVIRGSLSLKDKVGLSSRLRQLRTILIISGILL